MRRIDTLVLTSVVLFSFSLFTTGCSESKPPTAAATPTPPAMAPSLADAPTIPIATDATEAETSKPEGAKTDAARLAKVQVGAANPVHQHGRYYLAGQPAEGDFAEWKTKGVRTVISLRTPGEIDWDEKAAVEAQGMKFVSIPFRGVDTLGDKQIEEALAALTEDGESGVLLHCGTSNRVGAIWYAHRIRHDGLSPEAALEEAKQIGLRNTTLTDVINAYCDANPVSPAK
jgi:protein tyrosine phosphatase (PTP) superfamily phosphohydrolase (DUF442 family)